MRVGLAVIGAIAVALAATARAQRDPDTGTRFEAVHVYIDSGSEPLAAWQIDVRATTGDVRIVGIEGGDHPVYSDPPYYDPKAMEGERVIIADFATEADWQLPSGRSRIATIHVAVRGDAEAEYSANLITAASASGQPTDAKIDLEMQRQ